MTGRPQTFTLRGMSLDDDEPETGAADRCAECGARLTTAEMQAVRESGGPALCSVHAAEDEPGLAADEAGFLEE